ncbi:dephospho-CoA kinase [Virgibacillus sp. NKC19-3]|uniref:dephospho-CoA kinase n=1 Tax=Virgibacillus saliphilus TaxID=2831674 RepID=UPI001C9B5CC7|nr:dephospho-CoA kinase [Virgibacillus sp. NKC19-3]MBY7143839.1 dephospho-CoA kinase [Virgibacillus sp. NKC19-3]
MTLIIGLTGSIASGKSTVSLMFDDLNIPVIDADKISREVVKPGEKAYDNIIHAFGEDILREDNTLDREKLGSIVFADEERRKTLNRIVHPAVREKMLEQRDAYVQAEEPLVVLDIPLLFESKLTHFVDKVVVVYVEEKVQLQRLINRDGYTEEEAYQRIRAQIPIKEKAEKADAIINNNGDKYESYQQLEQLVKEWKDV